MIDRRQDLALKAALYPKDDAIVAWNNLRRISTIEELDHSVTRILPTVYQNIKETLSGNDLLKLKGATRHTWAKNTEFLHQLKNVILELDSDSTNYRVLKGGAINLLFSPHDFRIMGDIDLLISKRNIIQTREALARAGFKPKYSFECPHNNELTGSPELNFINDSSLEIDIHIAEERAESTFFKQMLRLAPNLVVFSSVEFKIPPIEFLIIHSIIHGQLGVESEDQAQTMLDVDLLLKSADLNRLKHAFVKLNLASSFNRYLELRMTLMGRTDEIANSAKITLRPSRFRIFNFAGKTYLLLSMLAKAIKYRTPKFRNLRKIWRQNYHNRMIYLFWLYTGLIRQIEFIVMRKYSGFIPKGNFPPNTIFPGSRWSNDWRFWVIGDSQRERTVIQLNSGAFYNQSFLIFSDGKLAAVTERSREGKYLLVLKNLTSSSEISLRLPFSGCKDCAQALVDLKITRL
jgi:Uncharacterised nucleotidyltransferase